MRAQETDLEKGGRCCGAHLLLVSFVGELDADVVVFPDLRDDGSLAADDFGMILWIYRHGRLEAAQGLEKGDETSSHHVRFDQRPQIIRRFLM